MITKSELEKELNLPLDTINYISNIQNSLLPYETTKWNLVDIYSLKYKFNFYTGIGSRETPDVILKIMEEFAKYMSKKGYILRSGGADGADSAFELGAEHKEIFLPWKGFNDNKSLLFNTDSKAFEIARKLIPHWSKLSQSVQKLHSRNIHQILGKNINKNNLSKFVILKMEKLKVVLQLLLGLLKN